MSAPPSASPRRKHLSLIRSFSAADFITLANAGSGMATILLCLAFVERQQAWALWTAFACLPLALACDVLDGYVARRTRRGSPYGADLDSLADIVSFGVAPAVLGYTLGLRGGWDALVLVYFVMCGIGRLARFNVTAESLTTSSGKVSHFEGTPIPTSLALVAVLASATATGAVQQDLWLGQLELASMTLHPLVLMYALSGSGMITATLRIPKP